MRPRCPYCQATRTAQRELELTEWMEILDKLASWGVLGVNIVGGEPTMRQDISELVTHIARRGMLPVLTTNGYSLERPQVSELVSSGLRILQISLDSLNGFGKSNGYSLELLAHARELGLLPIACAVATRANVEEIPSLAQRVAEAGGMFNCILYQRVGGEVSRDVPDLALDRSQTEELVTFLREFKATTGLLANLDVYLENLVRFGYEQRWKCNPERNHWVVVNTDGTLMPCQEYASPFKVLETRDLDDPAWIEFKRRIVANCQGCYWQPYVEREYAYRSKRTLLTEFRLLRRVSQMVG